MANYLPLHAVIGVRRHGERTYYVRRSEKMQNYPLVWSLLSIQHDPARLSFPDDLRLVSDYMNRMSEQRLGGVGITVNRRLLSGDQPSEVIQRHVFLHLYEIELAREPKLNQEFYV